MMNVKRIATVALVVTGLLAVCAALARSEQPAPPAKPGIASVAQQLGVKVAALESDSFDLGTSFTGLLEKPEKLAAFGIPNMLPGARVVVARVALDRVVVEADQLDPPRSGRVRLTLDIAGRLQAPPRT